MQRFCCFPFIKDMFLPRSQAWDLAIPYEQHDGLIETIMQARMFAYYLRLLHLFA